MKIIALLLTSIALVSCAGDSGHRDRGGIGSRVPDDTIDPDWHPTPPPMPRPGPPALDATLVERFAPTGSAGRVFIPDAPRLGDPPRESARRFPSPSVTDSLRPGRSGSILRGSSRGTVPPGTVIPRLPSPRPAETSRVRIPSRNPGIDSALRLDRTALSR